MAAECRTALAERFEVITKPDQAGLVTFRPTSDPTELVEKLRGEGVIVRELPGRNLIRVSCGYWTSDERPRRRLTAWPSRRGDVRGGASPSSPAIGRIASITKRMWSSSSTPSSSAPR